jgi:hypothetical protein
VKASSRAREDYVYEQFVAVNDEQLDLNLARADNRHIYN